MARINPAWLKRRCVVCDKLFDTSRHDARLCSPACRKKASRAKIAMDYVHEVGRRNTSVTKSLTPPPQKVIFLDTWFLLIVSCSGLEPYVSRSFGDREKAKTAFDQALEDPAFKGCKIILAHQHDSDDSRVADSY